MSYLVRTPASVETVAIIERLVIVLFLMFSFFGHIYAWTFLFLNAVFNNHMEYETYQVIVIESNYAQDLSDEEKM